MKRPARNWLLGSAAVLALGLGAWLLIVRAWLPSDAEVAARIAGEFEQRLGVGLKIGSAHWSLLPVPTLVLTDIATEQPRPITVGRIRLKLGLAPLLHRTIAVHEIAAENAVLPQASVHAFRGRWPAAAGGGGIALPAPWTLAPVPVARLRFRDVAWVDRRDIALAYNGDVSFDAGWRPRHLEAERAAAVPPARLRLDREAGRDRWRTRIEIGGGTWSGVSRIETLADGRLRASAELSPRDVDLEALVRTFGRRTPVAGRISGESTLVAEADTPAALLRSLHTRTTFAVQPATLTMLDIAKAVRTAGISRGGRTPLDELSGTLDTQATGDGVAMQYSNLKARSGVLSASGSLRLIDRRLDGEVAVDIVDGVVGVPLKIGGTVADPELSLTGGALTGAAIGSAVLPGVGTVIGARVGQQVEKLFGGGQAEKTAPRRGAAAVQGH